MVSRCESVQYNRGITLAAGVVFCILRLLNAVHIDICLDAASIFTYQHETGAPAVKRHIGRVSALFIIGGGAVPVIRAAVAWSCQPPVIAVLYLVVVIVIKCGRIRDVTRDFLHLQIVEIRLRPGTSQEDASHQVRFIRVNIAACQFSVHIGQNCVASAL